MRRAALAIVSTVAALVVLLSFKSHSSTSIAASTVVISTTAPTTSSSDPTATSSASAAGAAASTTSAAATSTTITGTSVDTRYGPVQVKITVAGGKVTAVDAVAYPTNDPKDQQINSYAVPQLDQEALAAGSAKIQNVSGATYTSDGYIQSLQSALDKAGLS